MSQTVSFINDTDLPVMVEGWKEIMNGLNQMNPVLVLPGEKIIISSITGEWFVNTYFKDIDYKNLWTLKNIHNIYEIGKFRKEPCFIGNYSWMETNLFTISREEENIFRFNYFNKL